MTDEVLRRLAATVRAQGALPDGAVRAAPEDPVCRPTHGRRAAGGPRAAGRGGDYALLVEAIREGYLLHYERGRVVVPAEDDLALLAGDQLYALGLAHLAEIGDLEAVVELADVISLSAQAQAAGDPELADAVWAAGTYAVGTGAPPQLREAKNLVRAGDEGARDALRRLGADGGRARPAV